MASRILGPVVAALLAAATGVLVAGSSTPADAASAVAACPGATGVTVIVDYNEVGGPTRAGCDPDGAGKSASEVFPGAGFALEYHPRQPGYVCKVTGLPDDRPCLENDSFWSLWWSDGESGEWRFSNQGVGGLTVPEGGYVAFAWHEGAGNAQAPDVVPTPHEEPEPTDDGNGNDDGDGDGDGDGNGDGNNNGGGGQSDDGGGQSTAGTVTTSAPTDTSEATVGPTDAKSPGEGGKKRRDRERDDPSASATSSSTVPAAGEITAGPPESDLGTDASADDGGALPTWIGLGLAVLVLGAAALVTLLRRRPE